MDASSRSGPAERQGYFKQKGINSKELRKMVRVGWVFYLTYMPGMHAGTHQRIGRCLIALGSWQKIGDNA